MLVQDYSLRHVTWAVLSLLMLKLVRFDERWRAWPELAVEIPTRRNGGWRDLPDGRTEVVWRLRDDVRWHDGVPVTASDALFTYELLSATPPPYPHFTIVDSIDEMLVPAGEPHTLVVRWKAGRHFATYEEWGSVLPRHLLEGEGLEVPEVRDAHPFLRDPVYDGPFRLAGWEPGSHLVLEAAGAHPRGAPRVDRVVFAFFDRPADLAEAVVDGTVDVTDITGFSPDDMLRIQRARPDVDVHVTPSLTWEHLDFNLADDVLRDRRVRRAIAHAVDRRAISERLYRGAYEPADSWLPPRHPAHGPVRRYDYAPALAAELLDAAGCRAGRDGRRRTPAGDPLVLELLTTAPPSGGAWTSSATRPDVADLLAQQLARVGVGVDVRLVPGDDLFPLVRQGAFRHLAMFAWSMGLETTGYLLWHSDKIPKGEGDWYGLNVSGWRHAENDRLLDAVTRALDEAERFDLMRRQQQVWAEELPALPLFFPPSITTAKASLRNVRPVGVFGSYITWNAWEWSWERAAVETRAGSPSAGWATSPR